MAILKDGKAVIDGLKRCNFESDHPALIAIAEQKLPADWRKIDTKAFAQSEFFAYNFDASGFAQIFKDSEGNGLKKMVEVRFFWFDFHKIGIAIENDFWAGTCRYYKFGCEHEMVHTRNLGRCYNEYKCKKCGFTERVDSSD